MIECPKCQGCGKVADSDDQEPWSVWMNLPLQSAAAVIMGIVKPIPCPRCDGTGRVGVHYQACATCRCEAV